MPVDINTTISLWSLIIAVILLISSIVGFCWGIIKFYINHVTQRLKQEHDAHTANIGVKIRRIEDKAGFAQKEYDRRMDDLNKALDTTRQTADDLKFIVAGIQAILKERSGK